MRAMAPRATRVDPFIRHHPHGHKAQGLTQIKFRADILRAP